MCSRYIFIILGFLLLISCSDSDSLDGDLLVGTWDIRDESFTRIDGKEESNLFIQNYILQLNDDNCGYRFNTELDTTNLIKWAYQEKGVGDAVLISTSFSSSGLIELFSNEVFEITKLNLDEIKMNRSVVNIEDGKEINAIRNLTLTPR